MKDRLDAALVTSTSIVALGEEFVNRIAVGSPLTAAVLDVLHAVVVDDSVPQPVEDLPEPMRSSLELLLDPEFEVLVAFRSGAELVYQNMYVTGDTAVRFDAEVDYRFWISDPMARADLAAILAAQFQPEPEDSSPFSVTLDALAYMAAMGWIAAYREHWLPLPPDHAVISAEEVAAALASDMVAETMTSLAGLGAPTALGDAYEGATTGGLDSLRELGLIGDQPDGLALTPQGAAALGPLAFTGLSLSLMAVRSQDNAGASTVLLSEAESGARAAVVPTVGDDGSWSFAIWGPVTVDDISAALHPADLIATPLTEDLDEWPAPLLAALPAAAAAPSAPPVGSTSAGKDGPSVEPAAPSTGSDSPPPPSPPRPPTSPTSGKRSNPQWLTYLIGGGLVLALVGVGVGLFGGDDSTGSSLAPGQAIVDSGSSSTTTLPASTTTTTTTATATPATTLAPVTVPATVESTTTSSSTTTTTSTTTTSTTTTTTLPPSLLEDNFDGSTTALPLFGPGVMTSVVNGDNQLQIEVSTSGVIPVTYPNPLPDGVEISFDFNPQPNASTAAFGVLVLSEDPSDTVIDHWVAVWANPSDGLLTVIPFDADSGGFGPPLSTPISGGFTADQWHTMRLVISGGQVEVHLDGVLMATWSGTTPVTAGYWGPVIAAAAAGDTMLVDNVLVEEL